MTAAGIEFVNRLTAALQSVPDPLDPGSSSSRDPNFGRLVRELDGHGLLSLPIFYSAQYWERAWTTQEMALARSCVLVAGGCTCLLGHVDAITGWAREFVDRTDTDENNLAGVTPPIPTFLRDIRMYSEQGLPIVTAMALWKVQAARVKALSGSDHDLTMSNLALTIHRKATSPRDKICSFAMLGPIGIRINYASQVQDVYTDFSARIVSKIAGISPLIEGAGVINRELKLIYQPAQVGSRLEYTYHSKVQVRVRSPEFCISKQTFCFILKDSGHCVL